VESTHIHTALYAYGYLTKALFLTKTIRLKKDS